MELRIRTLAATSIHNDNEGTINPLTGCFPKRRKPTDKNAVYVTLKSPDGAESRAN